MYPRKIFDFDYACHQNAQKPAKRYFDNLPDKVQADIKVLLNKLGDEGELADNRFKKLSGFDIWELTETQSNIRMLCFKIGRCFFFTNGFPKTSRETPPRFINVAERIMREHIGRMRKVKGRRNV